jgi:Protein of unknown function (DUF1552)
MDLIATAFACGLSHSATLLWQGASGGKNPFGSPGHHEVSHGEAPQSVWKMIDTWYAQRFAYWLAKATELRRAMGQRPDHHLFRRQTRGRTQPRSPAYSGAASLSGLAARRNRLRSGPGCQHSLPRVTRNRLFPGLSPPLTIVEPVVGPAWTFGRDPWRRAWYGRYRAVRRARFGKKINTIKQSCFGYRPYQARWLPETSAANHRESRVSAEIPRAPFQQIGWWHLVRCIPMKAKLSRPV